jgi:hypothetical protein
MWALNWSCKLLQNMIMKFLYYKKKRKLMYYNNKIDEIVN